MNRSVQDWAARARGLAVHFVRNVPRQGARRSMPLLRLTMARQLYDFLSSAFRRQAYAAKRRFQE